MPRPSRTVLSALLHWCHSLTGCSCYEWSTTLMIALRWLAHLAGERQVRDEVVHGEYPSTPGESTQSTLVGLPRVPRGSEGLAWPANGRYETKWYTSSFSLAPLDSSANDGSLPPAQCRISEGQAKQRQNKTATPNPSEASRV